MKPFLNAFAVGLLSSSLFPTTVVAQQPPSILGKTDLYSLLNLTPTMPANTADAAIRAYGTNSQSQSLPSNLDSLYDPFFRRATAAHNAIREASASRMKKMPSQAETERQTRAQVNANPITSGMGGMEKMQQMTPAQREAAARQSVANYQQNLVTGDGRNSPEMQAMMQKVMSDPAYRARLMQMNPREQEAEVRRNMGDIAPQTAEQHQNAQQQVRAGNETATAMAVRNEISQMQQRFAAIDADFARRDLAITNSPGNHQQIADEIGAKMANVPIVALGEYGHDRDPEQMMRLTRERVVRDRERADVELLERTQLYQQRKAQYAKLIAEYQTWLKQNLGRINTSSFDALLSNNPELVVIGCEDALISMMEDLAKYSKDVTLDASRYERDYQDKVRSSSGSVTRTSKSHS
jgi:hypothetical protein